MEIDGFDEMFAQIHTLFNKEGNIPISTSSFSRRPSEIIQKLLASENFSNSSSPILRKAYEQLERESKRNLLMDLILPRNNDETDTRNEYLSDDELITRADIQRSIANGAFQEAIDKGNAAIRSGLRSSLKQDIIKLIIKGHRALGELKDAVSRVDDLIADEPFNAANYIFKADLLIDYRKKIETLNKAIEINPYWYRSYYKKANMLLEKARNSYGQDKKDTAREALKEIDEGLRCDPSIENPCWYSKFDLITRFEEDRVVKIRSQDEIIDKLKLMNPESVVVLRLCHNKLLNGSEQSNQSEFGSLISKIDEIKKKKSRKLHSLYDEIILKSLININDPVEIQRRVIEVKKNYELTRHPNLAIEVAIVTRKKLGQDQEAIDLLLDCYRSDPDSNVVSELIYSLIDVERLTEAKAIYNKTCNLLPIDLKYHLELIILEAEQNYAGALAEIQSYKSTLGYSDARELYYLLKNNNFSEVKRKGKEFLENIDFNLEAKVEIVNYEYARKKLGEKFSADRLKKVMNFNSSDEEKSAIYSVLGEKGQMLFYLKKAIEEDKTFRFAAKKWPVFDEYQDDIEFKKIISAN